MLPYGDIDRKLASCARMGDGAGVRSAIRGGAGHHRPAPDGRLPLHAAASAGHGEVITALLEAGADLHATSGMPRDDGGTALHLAAEGGRTEALRLLATAGARLDAPDTKGRTAVHWAALRGQKDALVTLHTLGADLHALDAGHANALHFAAASGSLEAVHWLVEIVGVSSAQLDLNKRSPCEVAKRKGQKHVVNYLKQKGQHSAPLRRQPSHQGPSAWVYRQESPSPRPQSQHEGSARSSDTQHTYPARPHSQHGTSAWTQNQHEVQTRPRSQQDGSAWSHSQQNQHVVVSRSPSQQDGSAYNYSQQNQHVVASRSPSQQDGSAYNYSQQNQHVVVSRSPSQQDGSAYNYSQQNHHVVASRSSSQPEGSAWNHSQQGQHEALSRTRSQQEGSAWNHSQQNQHVVVSRSPSQPEGSAFNHSQQNQHVQSRSPSQQGSATWSHDQRRSSTRRSQRDTSAWIQSQQHQQEQQQHKEEHKTALALLTQQNQDARKKIADLEKREAEILKRSAADQQSLSELRREVDRLTGILQSEGRDFEGSPEMIGLREEVQHLSFMLDDAGRRAHATQEALQRKIEAMRMQEEQDRRTIVDLTRRLEVAEESNTAMMVEARDRERSETILRGEVDRLQLSLASAPKLEAFAELQARVHRLTEQDTIHRQAILTLRRELETARTQAHTQAPATTPTNPDHRRLREATMEAEKYKEEAAMLSARLQDVTARVAEAEKVAISYKHRWGECDRELREERESSGRTVAALREELAGLKSRMENAKKRAASRSLTRTASHPSFDG